MKEDNKELEIEQLNDDEIEAYLNAVAGETPDLWDRISMGFDSEADANRGKAKIVDLQIKRRKRILGGYLAAAAVLLIVLVAVKGSLDVKDRTDDGFIKDGDYAESIDTENMAEENMNVENMAEENTDVESEQKYNVGNMQSVIAAEDMDLTGDDAASEFDLSEDLMQESADDAWNDNAAEIIETEDGVNVMEGAKPSAGEESVVIDTNAVSEVTFKSEAKTEETVLSKKKTKSFIKLVSMLGLIEKNTADEAFDVAFTIFYDDGRTCEIELGKEGMVLLDGVYYEGDVKVIKELIDMTNIK